MCMGWRAMLRCCIDAGLLTLINRRAARGSPPMSAAMLDQTLRVASRVVSACDSALRFDTERSTVRYIAARIRGL